MGVHRARVASRRLREAMPVALAAALTQVSAREQRALRRLARALGAVREVDVTRALLEREGVRCGWDAATVSALARELVTERRVQRGHLLATLRRRSTRDLRRSLRRMSRTPPAADVAAESATRIRQALVDRRRTRAKALVKRLDTLGTLYVPDRLHAVRLAAKKLRYSLELERAVCRRAVSRDLATLEVIQEQLGRLHDLQVLQGRVARLARRGDIAPARAVALRRMDGDLEKACRRGHAAVLTRVSRWRAMAVRIAGEE